MDYEESYAGMATLADYILGNTRVSPDTILQQPPQQGRTKGLASRSSERAKAATENVTASMDKGSEQESYQDIAAQYLAGIRAAHTDAVGNNLLPGLPARGMSSPPNRMNVADPSEIGLSIMASLQNDYGLTVEQAAGVVGSFAQESGNFSILQEIDPLVEGSRGGFGYAQWTGERRVAFENWAKAQGLDVTSREANYGNLRRELDETNEGKVLSTLRNAKTTEEATYAFTKGFLRPSEKHANYASRNAYAESYANAYRKYASKRG